MSNTLPMSLSIGSCTVRQDAEARYCINDLHQAAGGEKRHQPSNWLQLDQTKALIAEIENPTPGIPGVRQASTPGIPGVTSQAVATKEGAGGGTFVVRELVYGYAMWVSPRFNLQVIRAFDALQAQPKAAPPDINRVHRWNAVHTANRWVLFEIPSDACILPPSEWPGVIRTTDFPRDLLPDVLNAVGERMKGLPPPGQGRPERNFAPTFRDVSRKVLGFIERYGRVGLARRDLISGCKPFRNLDSDKRGKLILQMLEDETIAEVETRPEGKGRPGKRLVHTKFIKKTC